jgi:hypothetical protein
MLPVRGRVLPVLLAAVVLVGGANLAAYAANGHPLLLGHANSESQPASVTNTGSGPALTLQTSKKSAPLAVTSSKVVPHLNADRVGGSSASALQTHATTWTIPGGTTMAFTLQGLAPGQYLATINIVLDAPSPSSCELQDGPDTPPFLTYAVNRGLHDVANGAALYVHGRGRPVQLNCNDVATAIVSPSTVTFVRLDRVAHGTSAPTSKRPAR